MNHRILVVDDDPLVLRSVERALLRAGHKVFCASNREEALVFAKEVVLDLALVDYALGREDGLTVMGDLRDLMPSCLRVLMTGNRDFPMVVDAINSGEVVRVLRKPFQSADLLGLVEDAFDSRRKMEQRTRAKLVEGAAEERRALEECLNRKMLRLALQPILDVSGGAKNLLAYEALLRPQHEVLSNPMLLLTAAERHNRVMEVGGEVFGMASDWLKVLPSTTGLFVNLHPLQLGDPALLAKHVECLLPMASRVTIVITERSSLQDIDRWDEAVQNLTDCGFAIALDDLGAGYNSLTMLADLNPQYVKLDMSLVRNIHERPRSQRLIQLLVGFAEGTSCHIIAEGVEIQEEVTVLEDLGIILMQGYFYGRPSLEVEI
ncbi:MAG: EAL domain-containing protein [Rhodobacterales bacterium]|nr:EAL domain-containing protein [Rhodobacterales bacterium]